MHVILNPEYVGLEEAVKEIVKGMVRKEVMTGTKFTHRYDEEDGSTVEWNVKFVREKRRASGLMTLCGILAPWTG